MFRFYHTYDLNSEIEKELLRATHLVQILIDEYDLFVISKALFMALDREVNVEIVIISANQNKSMKLVNLCKRLIDQEVLIYWKMDTTLFTKEDYFAIFDKQYLICRTKQADFEKPENLLRSKNDYFNGVAQTSQRINLLSGEIDIGFTVNRTIVNYGGTIRLKWETKNAHEIVIYPNGWVVDSQGVKSFSIAEDTKFTLEAKNKDKSARKSLFVRVIKESEIDFGVEVYDPVIKDYIVIQAASTDESLFAAYLNQKIKLTWNITMIGKLTESQLGKLPLVAKHEFILNQNENFLFTFKSLNGTQLKKISFHCFYDEIFFKEYSQDESEQKSNKQSEKESVKSSTPEITRIKEPSGGQKWRSFFVDFRKKLFNIFNKKNN